MLRRTITLAACSAALWAAGCASPSTPSPDAALVGTYRLLSFKGLPDGEAPVDVWGPQPRGYIVVTPQRFMAVLTAQDRRLPAGPTPTVQDFAASFVSQAAYTGPYRLEGNRLITRVDTSSFATWLGTEQVREYRLEGRRLHLTTLPGPIPGLPGKNGRSHLVWEKIE